MAKVQIKSEKLTPFGGIFSIMEQFDSMLSPIIDQTLGQRCLSIIGYQYSEIVRSLMSVYFCGGSCVENVTSHLMRHLSCHPMLRTCSIDTILRAIKELTQDNISYTSNQGKTYDFNTADNLNALIIKALISTGELNEVESYDVDFDHQFFETENELNSILVRNGKASAIVLSFRDKSAWMESLTCGKVNTPTDPFLPTIMTHQQETSSNFTTSVGAKSVYSMI